MKKFSLLMISFIAFLFLEGCYKDFENEDTDTRQDSPEVIIDHNLVGQVVNQSRLPLPAGTVTYNAQTSDLAERDFFYVEAKQVNQFFEPIAIEYQEIKLPYLQPMLPNQTNYTRLIVPDQIEQVWIDPMEKFVKDFDGISCHFEANSIRLGGGAVPETVKVFFSSLSYQADGLYPGGWRVFTEECDKLLCGKNYFIIEGEDELTFDGELRGLTQDLFYFNKEKLSWEMVPVNQDGVRKISRTGIYAEGLSVPYVLIKGAFTFNDGQFLNAEGLVFSTGDWSSFTMTTLHGQYLNLCPQNSQIHCELSASCGFEPLVFTTEENEINPGEIVLAVPQTESHRIVGQVRNCSNDPLDENYFLRYSLDGQQHLKMVDRAQLDIRIINCAVDSDIDIFIENIAGDEISETINYTLKDTISLYHILVCNAVRNEYVSIEIEGVDQFLFQGIAEVFDEQIVLRFYDAAFPNMNLSLSTRSMRDENYSDSDLNIVFEAPDLGAKGYELQCGSSTSGCGFEKFVIWELGAEKDDYIRGYYKGRFWVKTFKPILQAGYKNMEGVFHVKRSN